MHIGDKYFIFSGLKSTSFFVSLGPSEHFQIGEGTTDNPAVIMWNDVRLNEGGHFDSHTGAYVTPLKGTYWFTVMKRVPESMNYFYLYLDDQIYTKYGEWDKQYPYQSGGFSLLVKLDAGVKVQVKSNYTTNIIGYENVFNGHAYSSWFCGHLLFSD